VILASAGPWVRCTLTWRLLEPPVGIERPPSHYEPRVASMAACVSAAQVSLDETVRRCMSARLLAWLLGDSK
jgi:hypothetical protein